MNIAKQEAERIFKNCVVIIHDWNEDYVMSLSIEKIKQDNQCRWHRCKRMALKIIDEILQTNPTIKGTSEDFVTQIVQTKAYYYQLQDEINKL
jgi:hypothetical protein